MHSNVMHAANGLSGLGSVALHGACLRAGVAFGGVVHHPTRKHSADVRRGLHKLNA
jgi:hypothetical protein